MTEEEQFYYDQLDEENKKNVDLIVNELKSYLNKDTLDAFSQLDGSEISNFLHDNDILLYNSYKNEIKTVFALAKYITLYKNELISKNKIEQYLNRMNLNIPFFFINNFKDELVFTTNDNNQLKIRYSYDPENEKIGLYLVGHSKNFEVSIKTLEQLLSNKPVIKEMKDDKQFLSNSKSDNEVSLIFNGMKIIIQKQ